VKFKNEKEYLDRLNVVRQFAMRYPGIITFDVSEDYVALSTLITLYVDAEVARATGHDRFLESFRYSLRKALGDNEFTARMVAIITETPELALLEEVKLLEGVINAEMMPIGNDMIMSVFVDANRADSDKFQAEFILLAQKHKPKFRIKLKYIQYIEKQDLKIITK